MTALIFDFKSAMHAVLEDAALLKQMADLLFEESAEVVETLKGALAANDSKLLSRTAHAFRGSCVAVGAAALAEVLASIEQLGQTGSVREAENLIAAIPRELARFKQEFEKALEKGS